jgi:hypothetical protein
MTLADRVKHNVLAKEICERGKAFEYYYQQLKIMVASERLFEHGEVTFFNRIPLNGQNFSNKGSGSRWYAYTRTRELSQNHEIHLTLMR